MFTGNTETNISATYQDGDGTIDLVGTQMTFVLEDDDGTEVSISDAEEIKFHSGDTSVDINYSDISPGSDADPFDLDFRTLHAPYLKTDDDRDFAPEDLANTIREISGRFSTKTGLEDGSTTNAGDYVDVLVLDTFTGHTGGDANLLAFAKNSTKRIYHYRADQDATNWGTASTIAYTSDVPTTEAIQDIVGAMFSSNTETRVSATYQDGDGTIDLVADDMNFSVSDITGATALTSGLASTDELVLSDAGTLKRMDVSVLQDYMQNSLTFTTNTNTQLSTEQVQDIVGGMFSGNTETNITATYQDSDGTIDLVVSSSGGLSDLVDDTSPQLGGNLDTNSQNILIDDGHGILDDSSNEQLLFGKTTSANAYFKIWNGISDTTSGTMFGTDVVSSSGNTAGAGRMTGPGLEATGSQTDVGMSFKTKGMGSFVFTNDDASASPSPSLLLLRNNLEGEVADDDDIGIIKFMGADSAMVEEGSVQAIHDYRDYARIGVEVPDQTSGNADGELYISILVKDSQRRLLAVGSNNLAHGDTPAAGVAAKAGQVRTFSSNQSLDYDDYAGLYLVATSALTFTLPSAPNRGEQYVIISDTTGTVTIDRNGNTINGASSNATITTRYEAKTFIAMDSGAYIMLG